MDATETDEARDILTRALRLPAAVREEIAVELLDSVDPPPDDRDDTRGGWAEELRNRWADIQRGAGPTYSAAETLEYARERLRRGERP